MPGDGFSMGLEPGLPSFVQQGLPLMASAESLFSAEGGGFWLDAAPFFRRIEWAAGNSGGGACKTVRLFLLCRAGWLRRILASTA